MKFNNSDFKLKINEKVRELNLLFIEGVNNNIIPSVESSVDDLGKDGKKDCIYYPKIKVSLSVPI